MAHINKRVNGKLQSIPGGKASVPLIGQRTMSPEHRAAAQEAILLINHHKQIVAQIENGLADMLKQAYGVDIRLGQWRLDFATGAITQVTDQPK